MNTRFTLQLVAMLLGAASTAAHADVVIIVGAHSALTPSVEQVCQAFLGKTKTPTPVNSTDATRDEFHQKACKKDPNQVRTMWGKLIFTGTGTLPKEVASSADMKKAVAADANSVGYLDKKDLDASVKVIAALN